MSSPWTYFGVDPSDGRGQQLPQHVMGQVFDAILTTPAPTHAKENAVRGLLRGHGAAVGDETGEYLRQMLEGFQIFAEPEVAAMIDTMFLPE